MASKVKATDVVAIEPLDIIKCSEVFKNINSATPMEILAAKCSLDLIIEANQKIIDSRIEISKTLDKQISTMGADSFAKAAIAAGLSPADSNPSFQINGRTVKISNTAKDTFTIDKEKFADYVAKGYIPTDYVNVVTTVSCDSKKAKEAWKKGELDKNTTECLASAFTESITTVKVVAQKAAKKD